MRPSHIAMAAQLGFDLGRRHYICGYSKSLSEIEVGYIAIPSLMKNGIYKTSSTISAFIDGYKNGWQQVENVAKASKEMT